MLVEILTGFDFVMVTERRFSSRTQDFYWQAGAGIYDEMNQKITALILFFLLFATSDQSPVDPTSKILFQI